MGEGPLEVIDRAHVGLEIHLKDLGPEGNKHEALGLYLLRYREGFGNEGRGEGLGT